jgi:hypothetical protein
LFLRSARRPKCWHASGWQWSLWRQKLKIRDRRSTPVT